MIELSQSSDKKAPLIEAIGLAVMRYQDSTQSLDETVGEIYDLNPAERHCLSFIWPAPQTASAIAREIRLTPASVTALIDRLEKRGLVRRRPDPTDRRRVYVEATAQTKRLTEEAYLPTGEAGAAMLGSYSAEELAIILRFIGDATAVQERMIAELLKRGTSRP